MNDKIKAYVYETDDYSKFKKLKDNRDVVESRRDKLVSSFSARQILNPIVVNENFEIIDGQGRYEALKMLKRPIEYVIAEGANINDCRRMNLYNERGS